MKPRLGQNQQLGDGEQQDTAVHMNFPDITHRCPAKKKGSKAEGLICKSTIQVNAIASTKNNRSMNAEAETHDVMPSYACREPEEASGVSQILTPLSR